MTDFVTLLGTKGGPAIRPGSAMPTSSLLALGGTRIVVDCGLGVTKALVDQGMALKDLALVAITHLHSDHYLELGPLLHTAWVSGLKTPVAVWGPSGLEGYWQGFLASMQADIDLRTLDEGRPDLRNLVSLHVIRPDTPAMLGPVEMRAMPSLHPPLTECFSLAFAAGGKRVVFSGDTAFNPALADFAKGADLLIHEAMLEPALGPLLARIGNGDDRLMHHWLRAHTLAADAARTATMSGVKALALHHLIPSDDPDFGPENWATDVQPHYDGPLHVGRDGLQIAL